MVLGMVLLRIRSILFYISCNIQEKEVLSNVWDKDRKMKETRIRVTEKTWTELSHLKINLEVKTLDDAIQWALFWSRHYTEKQHGT